MMLITQNSELLARGESLFLQLLSAKQTISDEQVEEWLGYESAVKASMASGTLEPSAVLGISILATNARAIASSQIALAKSSDQAFTALTEQIKDLAVDRTCRFI